MKIKDFSTDSLLSIMGQCKTYKICFDKKILKVAKSRKFLAVVRCTKMKSTTSGEKKLTSQQIFAWKANADFQLYMYTSLGNMSPNLETITGEKKCFTN